MTEAAKISEMKKGEQTVCRGWRIKKTFPAVYVPAPRGHPRKPTSSNSYNDHSSTAEEEVLQWWDTQEPLTHSSFSCEALAPYLCLVSRSLPSPNGSQVLIKVCASGITPGDVLKVLDRQEGSLSKKVSYRTAGKSSNLSALRSEDKKLEENMDLHEGFLNCALNQEPLSQGGWLSSFFWRSGKSIHKGVRPTSTLDVLDLSFPSALRHSHSGAMNQQGYWGGTVGIGLVEEVGEIRSEDDVAIGDRVLFYSLSAIPPNDSCTKNKEDKGKLFSKKPSEREGGGAWGEYVIVERDMMLPLRAPAQRISKKNEGHLNTAQKELTINFEIPEIHNEGLIVPSSSPSDVFSTIKNEEAAAILFPGCTAYIALFDKLRVRPQESLLVIGGLSDPVGFIAAQVAQFFGLHVWVSFTESEEREDAAMKCLRQRDIKFFNRSNIVLEPHLGIIEEHEQSAGEQDHERKDCEHFCKPFDYLLICSMRELSEISRPSSGTTSLSSSTKSDMTGYEFSSVVKQEKIAPLQDRSAKVAGKRWCEFILHHTCIGGNVCVTSIPPSDALLFEFHRLEENDPSGRMRGLRRNQLSLHFVFPYGLLQHPLTRSLLLQVGVKVCQLYGDGAFQLHSTVPSSTVESSPRVARENDSDGCRDERNTHPSSPNGTHTARLHESTLKCFSIFQLPEALVEEARRRNFFCRNIHMAQKEGVHLLEEQRNAVRRAPPLFPVISLDFSTGA